MFTPLTIKASATSTLANEALQIKHLTFKDISFDQQMDRPLYNINLDAIGSVFPIRVHGKFKTVLENFHNNQHSNIIVQLHNILLFLKSTN